MVVDQNIVDGVQKAFKIEHPIIVSLVEVIDLSNPERVIGQYHPRPNVVPPCHSILILNSLTVARANEVFWHEFGHVRQAEEVGLADYGETYATQVGDVGYRASRYEADAEEHVAQFRQIDVIYPF